jgi:Flp pilus assembly protein TadD
VPRSLIPHPEESPAVPARETPHEDAALYIGYAEVHLQKGEVEKAVDAFGIALRFEERSLVALRGLGRTLLRLGRLDEALQTLQRAIAIAPEDPPSVKLLGEAYAKRGRFDLAATHFARATELEQDEKRRKKK